MRVIRKRGIGIPMRWFAAIAALSFSVAACGADPEEAGELGTVEANPEEAGVELNEVWPFEQPDVGNTVFANALVVGTPSQNGFFARTENRVFFVEGNFTVNAGQMVRVVGVVQPAVQATYETWERDLLGTGETEWEVDRTFYVDATSVTPM